MKTNFEYEEKIMYKFCCAFNWTLSFSGNVVPLSYERTLVHSDYRELVFTLLLDVSSYIKAARKNCGTKLLATSSGTVFFGSFLNPCNFETKQQILMRVALLLSLIYSS